MEDRLAEIIAPALAPMGFDLVLVRLTGGAARPNLQVMAERIEGDAMTIEDCAAISRALDGLLEQADLLPGSWQLEVSSPGIDRPLVRPKDWARAIGRLVRVELARPIEGRRRFSGVLLGAEEATARLRLEDGNEVVVPRASVQRARLVLTPELLAAPQRAVGCS